MFVDDVVAVNLWFLEHPESSGIFNLGTGRAQPFNDVALAVVAAVVGAAIVLITHDLGVVSDMAQRVVVMYAGREIESGSAAQVLRSPASAKIIVTSRAP